MVILEDLEINLNKRELIALVGAGGKTTTMFILAEALRARGKKVLVTTTTAIYYPEDSQFDEIFLVENLENSNFEKVTTPCICILGKEVSEEGKLLGVSKSEIDKIFKEDIFDYILVEGDGSKKRAIKAPADHEPVIPSLTTKVIGVIGMDAYDKQINVDNVHRVSEFCEVTKSKIGDIIDLKVLENLIKHPQGLFKSTPIQAKKYLLLNKVNIKRNSECIKEILNKGISYFEIEKIIIRHEKEGV